MSKKTRGPNFTVIEKDILINLITKYKDVVENKKTDNETNAKKNKVWRKISDEFNLKNSSCVRNTEQLKTLWENIKRTTRKDNAKTKKEIRLTTGIYIVKSVVCWCSVLNSSHGCIMYLLFNIIFCRKRRCLRPQR